MMFSENDTIQEKLIDRVADLDAARGRWIFAIVVSIFLFSVVLGVFIAPVSELSTQKGDQFKINPNQRQETSVETVAIPYTYLMHFEFELDPAFKTDHSSAYIYVFKDSIPEIGADETGPNLHQYLKDKAFRNATINAANPKVTWDIAFRDCDTNTYSIMVSNPDDPIDPFDTDVVRINWDVNYEPMLPLIPIFFILAFIVVLPLAIIRLYVISQKKKELRVLLSLDFENLSDEDKLRLGIPLTPKPQAPVMPPQQDQGPPIAPTQPGQLG
jgi:hypothetical protein